MVFFVINRANAPFQVTIDKQWSPEKPDGYRITLSAKPLPSGIHATTFRMTGLKIPHPVTQITVRPDPLVVEDRLCARWIAGPDKDGDFLFIVEELYE